MALGRDSIGVPPGARRKETSVAKDEESPVQNILDALQREKEGYQRRSDATDDKDLKARLADRIKQVDKELARVKKSDRYTPEAAGGRRRGRGDRGLIETATNEPPERAISPRER